MEFLKSLIWYVKNERAYLEALRPEAVSWSPGEKAIFDFAEKSVIVLEARTATILRDLPIQTDQLQ